MKPKPKSKPRAKPPAQPETPGRVDTKGPASSILDTFSNPLARIGVGQNVESGTQYNMTRFTFQYWTLQTLYRNSWLVAKVIDGYPNDMLKNGIKLEGLDPRQSQDMENVIRVTSTLPKMLRGMKWGRLFGGAACIMLIEGHEDALDKPLDIDSVGINAYKGLLPLDRWSGIQPKTPLISDINSPEFGLPSMYSVSTMVPGPLASINVHHSRLLRFIGHDLPNWEKQVEQYWGISELERMIDELSRWDNAVGSAIGLLMRANIFAIKFDQLAQALSGIGMNQAALQNFWNIIQAQNSLMSNQGMLVLPKEGGLENHSYSFSGIDDILMLFRGNIAGATEYPQSRLFGETQTGLGQTNGGDEGIYYDNIKQKQTRELSPILNKLLPVIAMSTLGEIPEDMTHSWPPNWVPTGKEKAEIFKTNIDGIVAAYNAGIITQKRAITELRDQSAETGMFSSIEDKEIESASDELLDMTDMAGSGEEGDDKGEGNERD